MKKNRFIWILLLIMAQGFFIPDGQGQAKNGFRKVVAGKIDSIIDKKKQKKEAAEKLVQARLSQEQQKKIQVTVTPRRELIDLNELTITDNGNQTYDVDSLITDDPNSSVETNQPQIRDPKFIAKHLNLKEDYGEYKAAYDIVAKTEGVKDLANSTMEGLALLGPALQTKMADDELRLSELRRGFGGDGDRPEIRIIKQRLKKNRKALDMLTAFQDTLKDTIQSITGDGENDETYKDALRIVNDYEKSVQDFQREGNKLADKLDEDPTVNDARPNYAGQSAGCTNPQIDPAYPPYNFKLVPDYTDIVLDPQECSVGSCPCVGSPCIQKFMKKYGTGVAGLVLCGKENARVYKNFMCSSAKFNQTDMSACTDDLNNEHFISTGRTEILSNIETGTWKPSNGNLPPIGSPVKTNNN